MKLKKITKWSTVDKNGKIKFNHAEDGWIIGDKPQPIKPEFVLQYRWEKENWKREYAYLDENNKVVPV